MNITEKYNKDVSKIREYKMLPKKSQLTKNFLHVNNLQQHIAFNMDIKTTSHVPAF